MTTQLSKADQIRKLLHLSDAEIVAHVGCHDAYVRAVRYRTSSNGHPIDRPSDLAWRNANWDRVIECDRDRKRKRRAEARAS
jgi:hypothetical protein